MNPLRILRSLFELLQGDRDPSHIAAGFALGAALGLVPKGNLFAVVFLLIFFVLRVDQGMALLSAAAFTPLGYALDAPAHWLGSRLLLSGTLKPLWTLLYNLPIVPWTKFNNTVVLGNLAIGLLLYAPLFFASRRAVIHYRAHWKEKVDRLSWMRALRGSALYQRYLALSRRL